MRQGDGQVQERQVHVHVHGYTESANQRCQLRSNWHHDPVTGVRSRPRTRRERAGRLVRRENPRHQPRTSTPKETIMRKIGTWLIGSSIAGLATLALTAAPASAETPTCSSTLGIAVHGQHIVGDYVTGLGHENISWPPSGEVGQVVAGEGPAIPG